MRVGGAGPGFAAGASTLIAVLAPALVAILLGLPRLGLGYFWDDYIFLSNAQASPLTDLLPTPGYPFYRPLSRGAVFDLLLLLGPHGSLAAHALNLALFAASAALLASLAGALAGARAGLLAGLAFAAFGPAPGLVAWASGSQDLLAIACLLAALHLRHARRTGASLVALSGALLSKEPAVLIVPVLILWDWLLGRPPFRIGRNAAYFGGLAALWGAVHPALRELASGTQRIAASYVGLGAPDRWATYGGRYLLTLLNVPITGLRTPWPGELAGAGIVTAAVVLPALYLTRDPNRKSPRAGGPSLPRIVGVATLIAVPQLLLPAALVRVWLPYFACLPAIGAALAYGAALARAPTGIAALACFAYLGLGIWSRGMEVQGDPVYTERTFVVASRAVRRVERNYRLLHPTMPRGVQVSLSIAATGRLGITQTMLAGRALRIWYADPALTAVLPERHRRSGRPEMLHRITSDLSVVEIDPDRIAFRWAGGDSIDSAEIVRPIRAYWRGAAASGETDRAADGLLRLAAREPPGESEYDRRLAAMVLLSSGQAAAARRILDSTAAFPHGVALEAVRKLLAETSGDAAQDSSAFPAFGLSPRDPPVARYLMRALEADGLDRQALHFARRLQAARPGDMESAGLIRRHGG
ncbi:MAG TPA: hypothetical protein VID50_06510 [Candidatus Eisenbacteria bacterium]|jgi:hypothetical protein